MLIVTNIWPVSQIFDSSAFPMFTSRTSYTTSYPLSRRALTTALSATPHAPFTHTLRQVHQLCSSTVRSGRSPGDDRRDRGRRLGPHIGCKNTHRCPGCFVTLTIRLDVCKFLRVHNDTND